MKKILYSALAVALIGLVSCNKSDETTETDGAVNAKIVNDIPTNEGFDSANAEDTDSAEEIEDEIEELEISNSISEDESGEEDRSKEEVKEEKKSDRSSSDKKHDESSDAEDE